MFCFHWRLRQLYCCRVLVSTTAVQRRIEKIGVKVSRAKIKEKWNLLKSVGCSDDHINCYSKILSIPTLELKMHIGRLRRVGCDQMSVGALRLSRIYTKNMTEFETKLKEYSADDFNLTATSCDILRCSQTDVDTILDRCPWTLDRLTYNPKKLKENVDLLYEYGYNVHYIFKYSSVLRFNHNSLQQKLELAREIEKLENTTIFGLLYKPIKVLEEMRQRAYNNSHLQSQPGRLKEFSKMFQVDENDLLLSQRLKQSPIMLTKNKLALLEEAGYKPKELMCKPVIFKYSEKSIKTSIEFITVTQPESLGDIIYLINVLEDDINRRNKDAPERVSKHMAQVLGVSFSSFSKTQKQLFGITSLSTVNENMTFLKKKGFSLNDIKKCPLILVQDVDMVQKCYNNVQTEEHLRHFREDKVKCLNVVQYLIEYQSVDYEE